MAYNELIKNFERIRAYMRDFYVYGFKSRDEFDQKSSRSYDDERRRIESWLGDYMSFRQTPDGKNVFISIDSRVSHHNPLYKAWKAKINGCTLETLPLINGAFLGVELPGNGDYEVVLDYKVQGAELGVFLSTLGLIMCVVMLTRANLKKN